MASFRQINEGLRNYLYGPLQPPNPGPTSTRSPRLPLGPDAAIPPGRRPIPNSSEQNKKTNVQIPCARMAPVPIAEGEIVCVLHAPYYLKRKAGTPGHEAQATVQVYTLEQANASLAAHARRGAPGAPLVVGAADAAPWTEGGGTAAEAGRGRFRLDGVVNNSEHDGMLYPPYVGDYGSSLCLVNVAVQGPCRLLNDDARRCDMRRTHCGSVVYVGIWQRATFRPLAADENADFAAGGNGARAVVQNVMQSKDTSLSYRFERFSSTMLSAGAYSVGTPLVSIAGPGGAPEHAVVTGARDARVSLDETFAPADWLYGNGTDEPSLAYYGDSRVPTLVAGVETGRFRSFGPATRDAPFGWERLVGAYVVGMTADSNQSPDMLTVHVNVDLRTEVQALADTELAFESDFNAAEVTAMLEDAPPQGLNMAPLAARERAALRGTYGAPVGEWLYRTWVESARARRASAPP